MNIIRSLLATTSAIACSVVLGTPAMAQTAPQEVTAEATTAGPSAATEDTSAPDVGPRSSVALDEIVVTARKRPETLESAPLSVTAVSGDRMAEEGVTNLEQLSASIPNVQFGRNPQTASISIRGIGSGMNRGFEQSVGMYIDGVYMARSRQYMQPMIDLERVEILRGPQGTLFGKNTVAGAVNITTAAAEAGEPLFLEATGDWEPEFETFRATGIVSAPLTDTLGVRAAGWWETTDGYVDNEQTGKTGPAETVKFARGSVNFEPSKTFSAVGRISYTDRKSKGNARVIRVFDPSLGVGLPTNATIGAVLAPIANPDFGPSDGDPIDRWTSFTGNLDEAPNDTDDQKILNSSFNAKVDLGWGQINSVTGYTKLEYDLVQDVDFLPINLVQNREREDFSQFSQELRLSVDKVGPVSGIFGVYYENQDLSAATTTKVDGTLGGLAPAVLRVPTIFAHPVLGRLNDIGRASDFDQDAQTIAVFGEATVDLAENLRADLGLRWSHDTKDVHKTAGLFGSDPDVLAVLPSGASTGALTPGQTGLLKAIMGGSFATFAHDQNLSRKENHLTPSVNVQYDLPGNALAYLSWSQGFKSGGFNVSPDTATPTGAPGPGTEFDDETVDAWELGLKGRFLGNRGRASVALFRADYKDLQVTSFRGTQFVVGNAGEVRSQGAEFETEVATTDWLKLGGAVAYLDSEYTSFESAPCTIRQLAQTPVGTACVQDLSGRTTPFASKWSGNLNAEAQAPITDSLIGKARVDVNWRSSMYLDGDLDPNVRQDGYAKINARVALAGETGRWEVAVFGRNLTNKATYTFSLDAPLSAGAFVAGVEEPRVIGLQLRIKN